MIGSGGIGNAKPDRHFIEKGNLGFVEVFRAK